MNSLLEIGQWQGFFTYGPEYGEIVRNKDAEFRLFIEQLNDDQFSGRIIDWEGMGAEGEISIVKGFVHGELISFTKTYSNFLAIDEFGNSENYADMPGHTVYYEGQYVKETNIFEGTWEIREETASTNEILIEDIATGTWFMNRH
jgi:hypothetical protein